MLRISMMEPSEFVVTDGELRSGLGFGFGLGVGGMEGGGSAKGFGVGGW